MATSNQKLLLALEVAGRDPGELGMWMRAAMAFPKSPLPAHLKALLQLPSDQLDATLENVAANLRRLKSDTEETPHGDHDST